MIEDIVIYILYALYIGMTILVLYLIKRYYVSEFKKFISFIISNRVLIFAYIMITSISYFVLWLVRKYLVPVPWLPNLSYVIGAYLVYTFIIKED